MQLCESCQKRHATVRVTEVFEATEPGATPDPPRETHLCEDCLRGLELPHGTAVKKGPLKIMQMIQATRAPRRPVPSCKSCGMSLEEFRRKGRLGCPGCYEAFQVPLLEVLERVHGARRHVGRLPGLSDSELERLQSLADLRQQLEVAIREEAYESAARLRDEIQTLEAGGGGREPV
jgi:protein arginine kinase activator